MLVKFKRLHKDAVIPSYSKPGDAGMDLTAVSVKYDDESSTLEYDTGIAIEIPEGFVGLIYPRSSIYKKNIRQSNSVGVIDSGYRGSIKIRYAIDESWWDKVKWHTFQEQLEGGEFIYYETAEYMHRDFAYSAEVYAIGDRIGQLIIMPYPKIEFEEVDELSDTERGTGGYGSTGQ